MHPSLDDIEKHIRPNNRVSFVSVYGTKVECDVRNITTLDCIHEINGRMRYFLNLDGQEKFRLEVNQDTGARISKLFHPAKVSEVDHG